MDEATFARYSAVLVSKWGKDEARYHMLAYHLLDAAAVSLQMWDQALSEAMRADVTRLLGTSQPQARARLALWCALHDLGKISPAFQMKNAAQMKKAAAIGFPFKSADQSVHHSVIGGQLIDEHHYAPQWVAIAISGHHGTWNLANELPPSSVGGGLWQDYRQELAQRLRVLLDVDDSVDTVFQSDAENNALAVWLSGWLSIVDWLASNKEAPDYRQGYEDFAGYLAREMQDAGKKLRRLGWLGWRAGSGAVDFAAMYPRLKAIHPIQQRVIDETQPQTLPDTFLLVLEIMTGSGKTETALHIADQWLQRQGRGGAGMYVALPTMATSNQMYARAVEIFQTRYPDHLLPFVLAHGQAAWSKAVNQFLTRAIDPGTKEGVVVSEWFQNNRKRALLTPFGVGTVDQALMSVLQTKHFFVRMAGLAGKVVIFDEVHAYDSHMRVLFARLLGWLRQLGTPVILLSATLPEEFRCELVKAYCGDDYDVPADFSYPRMTLAQPQAALRTVDLRAEVAAQQDRVIGLDWIDETSLLETLKARLRDGGCIAIICNTVTQAQAIYEMLQAAQSALGLDEGSLTLFHARFPQAWRQQREEEILRKFGKGADGAIENPQRPRRAVVVATQVIEQSLDLDFDQIISAFAPVDLLLQRAGRMHRHARPRPPALASAVLTLINPRLSEDGRAEFGTSEKVYDRGILWASYLALRGSHSVRAVQDTRRLIEQVYGSADLPPEAQPFLEELEKLRGQEQEKQIEKRRIAQGILVPPPQDRNLLYRDGLSLSDEESPQQHKAYQALTRESDGISLRIVCLHRKHDQADYLDREYGGTPIVVAALTPQSAPLAEIFGQSLTIQRSDVVSYLLENPHLLMRTEGIAALRFVYFMPFTDGVFHTPNYDFTLDPALGLRIQYIRSGRGA